MTRQLTCSWMLIATGCIGLSGCVEWKTRSPAKSFSLFSPDRIGSFADNSSDPTAQAPRHSPTQSGANKGKIALARLLERRGQMEQAERIYLAIVQQQSPHPVPYHRLGVIAAGRGNFPDAEQHFRSAQAMGPATTELLSDIGYVYYLQNRFEESERVLRQALKREPRHATTCNNLGLLLGVQGRYDESLAMFKRAVGEAEAHANLAYVRSQRGELQEARAGYLYALTLDNDLRTVAEALLQVSEQLQRQHVAASSPPTSAAANPPEPFHDQRGKPLSSTLARNRHRDASAGVPRPLGRNPIVSASYEGPSTWPQPRLAGAQAVAVSSVRRLPRADASPARLIPAGGPYPAGAADEARRDHFEVGAASHVPSLRSLHSVPPHSSHGRRTIMTSERFPTARPTWTATSSASTVFLGKH